MLVLLAAAPGPKVVAFVDVDVGLPAGTPWEWLEVLPRWESVDFQSLTRPADDPRYASLPRAGELWLPQVGNPFRILTWDITAHATWTAYTQREIRAVTGQVQFVYPPRIPDSLYWMSMSVVLRMLLHPGQTSRTQCLSHLMVLGDAAVPALTGGLSEPVLKEDCRRLLDLIGALPPPSVPPRVESNRATMFLRLVQEDLLAGHPYDTTQPFAPRIHWLRAECGPALLDALAHPHPLVRRNAVSAIALIRPPGAAAALSAVARDSHPGTEAQPWRSIGRVNVVDLEPGDRVQFRGGDLFVGTLLLDELDSGTRDEPVSITSYGKGRASVYAGPVNGILVHNCGGVVSSLVVFGSGSTTNVAAGIGIWMDRNDADLEHVTVDRVEVHGFGEVGLYIGSNSANFKGYRSVRVLRTDIHHNRQDGMFTWGTYSKSGLDPFSNKDFYVGFCRFFSNPGIAGRNTGHGLYLKDVQGAVVEYCEAFDNGSVGGIQDGGGPVGIWALQSDQVTIRFCHSHHNHSGANQDGGGFDFDGGVSNSHLYGNYSHDNEGPGILVVADRSWARPTTNNRIHDNISENDGRDYQGSVLLYCAPGSSIENLDLFHNVIFTGMGAAAVAVRQIGPAAAALRVCNNIFFATERRTLLHIDSGAGATFLGNDYFARDGGFDIQWEGSSFATLDAWAQTTGQELYQGTLRGYSLDPLLVDPGRGGSVVDLLALDAYRLQPASPMRDAGFDIAGQLGLARGDRDFYGTPLKDVAELDVGGHETAGEGSVYTSIHDRSQPGSLLSLAIQNRGTDAAFFLTFVSGTACAGSQALLLTYGTLIPATFLRSSYLIPSEAKGWAINLTTYYVWLSNPDLLHSHCASVWVDDY